MDFKQDFTARPLLNEYFNFTTIHSFAVPSNNSPVAYAGVWGGGTYKTTDYGNTWEKLESDEVFSAAAIAVDPEDPKQIADAMIRLIDNPKLAKKLGEQGRKRVLEEFTWEKAAEIIEETMSKVKREK